MIQVLSTIFVDADGGNILNIANTTDGTAFITYKKNYLSTQ